METIIIGKEYQKDAELVSSKKKLLCYNKDKQVLIYKNKHGIFIPTLSLDDKEEDTFQKSTSIQLEPLVQIIFHIFRYQNINNRLLKQNLKYVRDYYTCLVEFDSIFEQNLKVFCKQEEVFLPTILPIEEAVYYSNQIYKQKGNKTIALETLNQKVKEKRL